MNNLFFVATAPSGDRGHVNLSPKGLDTFRVLADNRVAYLDLTGSGVETIAHVRDNGRITLMACAFSGNPRISRIYGRGAVHPVGTPEYDALAPEFPDLPGRRAIIEVAVERVTTSCGYAVPLMDLVDDRERLVEWASAKGDDGLGARNALSIDGLPGLAPGRGRRVRLAARIARARAWPSSASTRRCSRSGPLPYHRLRGHALERLTMLVLPARATPSRHPRLEVPRVAPRGAGSRSCRGWRRTTDRTGCRNDPPFRPSGGDRDHTYTVPLDL